jgi:hypothetical protein
MQIYLNLKRHKINIKWLDNAKFNIILVLSANKFLWISEWLKKHKSLVIIGGFATNSSHEFLFSTAKVIEHIYAKVAYYVLILFEINCRVDSASSKTRMQMTLLFSAV